MPWNPAGGDFFGGKRLLQSGAARDLWVPALDAVILAFSQAGFLTLVASSQAPVSNQDTTVWLVPAIPSYAGQGVVMLWDGSAWQRATPRLFARLLHYIGLGDWPALLSGVGLPPQNIGALGDLYQRLDAPGGMYGPKALTGWPATPIPHTANANVYNGEFPPDNALGVDGDYYQRTVSPGGLYLKVAGAWTGPLVHTANANVLSGTGTPNNATGANGDYWIRTDEPGGIYGPKDHDAWPGSPIAGTTRVTLRAGNGPPAAGVGNDGDFYLRQDGVGGIYGPKASGAWPATPNRHTANGNVISGAGGPGPGTGIEGDWFVRTDAPGGMWGPKGADNSWPGPYFVTNTTSGSNGAAAYMQTAAQSILGGARQKILLDTQEFGAGWDSANNRFVAPVSGFYMFHFAWVSDADSNAAAYFNTGEVYVNGTKQKTRNAHLYVPAGGGTYPSGAFGSTLGTITGGVSLSANDQLEFWVFNPGGSTIIRGSDKGFTYGAVSKAG